MQVKLKEHGIRCECKVFSVSGSIYLRRHDGILQKKPTNFDPGVYFHPIYLLNKVELLVFTM